jgi:uncharacterized protein YybS (DUF2232 family)
VTLFYAFLPQCKEQVEIWNAVLFISVFCFHVEDFLIFVFSGNALDCGLVFDHCYDKKIKGYIIHYKYSINTINFC